MLLLWYILLHRGVQVAGLALLEHALHGADPGLVGLALSYALGITSKLSGLVTSGQSLI